MVANEPSFQQEEMRLSRVEYAYKKIKSNITTNIFPAGFQILEPDLAEKLGVSRTPVREALIRLEADGLIRLIPRRGMLVTSLDIKEIREIFDLLQLLLSSVIGKQGALMASDESTPTRLLATFPEPSNDNVSAWLAAEENVFISIAKAGGSSRLKTVLVNLFEQVRRAKVVVYGFDDKRQAHFENIAQIVQALSSDNVDHVQQLVSDYLNSFLLLADSVRQQQNVEAF